MKLENVKLDGPPHNGEYNESKYIANIGLSGTVEEILDVVEHIRWKIKSIKEKE